MKLLRRTNKQTETDEEVIKTPMGKVEIVKTARRGLLGKIGLKKRTKHIISEEDPAHEDAHEDAPEQPEEEVAPTEDAHLDAEEEAAAEPEGEKTEEDAPKEDAPAEEPTADERDAEQPAAESSTEEPKEEQAHYQSSAPAPIEDVVEEREQPEPTPTTGMLCGCF